MSSSLLAEPQTGRSCAPLLKITDLTGWIPTTCYRPFGVLVITLSPCAFMHRRGKISLLLEAPWHSIIPRCFNSAHTVTSSICAFSFLWDLDWYNLQWVGHPISAPSYQPHILLTVQVLTQEVDVNVGNSRLRVSVNFIQIISHCY